jgi:signal transduction histidine kinase
MKYNFEKINLIPLIESVLRTMHYQLKQGKFKIDTSWPDKIVISADKDAFAGALMNLISNAIKYSEKDKYLGISITKESGSVVICLEDHGIGIADDEQKKIFDTFYRSRAEKVQSLGGAGLGLTLVQHIIHAHEGKMKVESKQGKGTKFFLYIPIEDKK